MEKTYNITAMRPAFIEARKNGNKSAITKQSCVNMGISEAYFNWYAGNIEKLFGVVVDYCRKKNSPHVKPEDVSAAYEKIFPIWKDLLSAAEKDKFTKLLRVTEHDISNLVGFCQGFVRDANDVSLGKDDTFCAHMAWATKPLKAFQKQVETDLGIRIEQVEVLSDTQRDFLREEGRILSRWKKAERRKGEVSAEIDKLNALKSKMKGDEAKALLTEQIDGLKAQMETLGKKIEEYSKAHDALLNPPAEPAKAPAAEPAKAPVGAADAKVAAPAKGKGKGKDKKVA